MMLAHAMHGVAHLHGSDWLILGAIVFAFTCSIAYQIRRRRRSAT